MTDDEFQWVQHPHKSYENWEPPPEIAGSSFAKRRYFFERHESHRNGHVVCPACGYPTLRERSCFDYCSFCHWEDDGQDDPWAYQPNGGPNDHSLTQARENFESTLSVFSFEEKEDLFPNAQYRLFSEKAQKIKKTLCSLYDGLMELTDKGDIEHQWERINEHLDMMP